MPGELCQAHRPEKSPETLDPGIAPFTLACPCVEGALFFVMCATSRTSFDNFAAIGEGVDDPIRIDMRQPKGANTWGINDPGIHIDWNG